MRLTLTAAVLSCALLLPAVGVALAQDHGHKHGHQNTDTPYAGLQTRDIKSLSQEDIEELRRGGGWGLALPAELNGLPGPAHLLSLKKEIGLTAEQVEKIEALYEDMRVEAIAAGERLIAAEAALSGAFASGDIKPEHLKRLLETAGSARADLRFIHLSRHLATPDLLTQEQIRRYNALRGYGDDT